MKKSLVYFVCLLFSITSVNAQSVEELRDSMAAGNLNCQVDLACKYIDGDGVKQDIQEGYRLIKGAAEKGNR